jgi:hypothetical protein
VIFIELQQGGLAYFRNPAFLQAVLYLCAGPGPISEGGETLGLDMKHKRLHITALTYTGTLVTFFLFQRSINTHQLEAVSYFSQNKGWRHASL